MTTAAGRLRHRLEILKPKELQDGFGEVVQTRLRKADERWGEIRPLSGTELEAAQAVVAEVTHEITMRNVEGLVTKDVLAFRRRPLLDPRRFFEILQILDPTERGELHLLKVVELEPSADRTVTE